MGALAEVPTIVKYLHTFLEEWNNVKEKSTKDHNDNDNTETKDKNQVSEVTTAVDRLKIKNRMPSQLSNSYLNEL